MRAPLILSFTSFLAVANYSIGAAQETKRSEPVSVKDFRTSKVIGYLGHPLGTVVRITGKCIDGDETRRKANAGQTLLQVQTVNGKALEKPYMFAFHRAAKDILKPKSGDAFDYYAHEWGEFDGIVNIPKDLGIDDEPVANNGFHYRPQITIHKSNVSLPHPTLQQK